MDRNMLSENTACRCCYDSSRTAVVAARQALYLRP